MLACIMYNDRDEVAVTRDGKVIKVLPLAPSEAPIKALRAIGLVPLIMTTVKTPEGTFTARLKRAS
jgi:hypothetical protein